MPLTLVWLEASANTFRELQAAGQKSIETRTAPKKSKNSKQEGLFKEVVKCVELPHSNPRHPGLETHEYDSIENPDDPRTKVFEAYVQNCKPGAYRIFWCCGPKKSETTIIAFTPHLQPIIRDWQCVFVPR